MRNDFGENTLIESEKGSSGKVRDTRIGYYGATLNLLYNSFRFRYCKYLGNSLKPVVATLALTNRCNSHCVMCNIWKIARERTDIRSLELSGQDIINLLTRSLFSELVELDLTGGEPNLREDLVDIIIDISKLKKYNLQCLKSIIVTSNGLLPEKVISNYGVIVSAIKGTGIDLVSVISLDGIGETHDQIRGTRGAYELALKTIQGLSELRKEYPHFIVGIKTTIMPQNLDMADSILSFALSNNFFHIISPVLFTEARFRNIRQTSELKLGPSQNSKLLQFYGHNELRTSYFYSREHIFLATGRKHWLCAAGFNYLFIDFDGKIYPCEIIPEPIGDLKKQSIEDIWNGRRAHYWRKRIEKLECCHMCNEPGAIRYSATTEGFAYLRFLMKLGRNEYYKSLHLEGYAKYFN